MNNIITLTCGTLLTAMISAGFSHYWSVQTFVCNLPAFHEATALAPSIPDNQRKSTPKTSPKHSSLAAYLKTAPSSSPSQEEFFDSLLVELKKIKDENRNLRDLMGETNRDVMKLAFRVDTHSESFRPLPASEERNDTSLNLPEDDFPGVLPPRATPVNGSKDD